MKENTISWSIIARIIINLLSEMLIFYILIREAIYLFTIFLSLNRSLLLVYCLSAELTGFLIQNVFENYVFLPFLFF